MTTESALVVSTERMCTAPPVRVRAPPLPSSSPPPSPLPMAPPVPPPVATAVRLADISVPAHSASATSLHAFPSPPLSSFPGATPGISALLRRSCESFGARFWIVDNSASMMTGDGHSLIGGAVHASSRWEELSLSLLHHAQLAADVRVPLNFVLLNEPGLRAPRTLSVGLGEPEEEMRRVRLLLEAGPTGRTPLCRRIREVQSEIEALAPALREAGQRALVVIASDGEATDGDLGAALRPLRELPVWVVVRLCTDSDAVVNYWNKVDEELELDIDVLDDLVGEGKEVVALNPWLVYAQDLHLLREWGLTEKLFDVLDSKKLTPPEISKFLSLLLGGRIAHPSEGWPKFERR